MGANDCLICDEFDNYDLFHSVRSDRRGGGVTVMVDKALGACKIDSLCVMSEQFESCSTSFVVENRKYAIVGVYRPPSNNSISLFNDAFFVKLAAETSTSSHVIVAGDFNIDMFGNNHSSHIGTFVNEFNSLHYFPVISEATPCL